MMAKVGLAGTVGAKQAGGDCAVSIALAFAPASSSLAMLAVVNPAGALVMRIVPSDCAVGMRWRTIGPAT